MLLTAGLSLGLFAAMSWGLIAFAGTTGKIAGRIVDADTNDPLPSVNVVVLNTTLGATTDLNGEYFILNLPPGAYSLKASMVGYKEVLVQRVVVQTDLTSKLDFRLKPTVLEAGEEIIVVAEKPLIERDVTASRVTTSAENLARMPVDQMQEILALTAGAVEENGTLHVRGGRGQEVAYLIDGAVVADPLSGTFDSDIPELALQEVSVQTGGFGAEYGSAQSGIVNMVLKEGGPQYNGIIRAKTSDFSGYRSDPWHEQLWDVEGTLGGPVPLVRNLRFFVSSEYAPSEGNYPHTDAKPFTLQGKLTYNATPKVRLALSGFLYNNDYHSANIREYPQWQRTTIEDRNPDIAKDALLVDASGHPWYGNGHLDTEWTDLNGNGTYEQWVDLNGDGIKEASEWNDINGNGVMDSEDLNANRSLDQFVLFDNTPDYEARANQFGFTLTHTLSQKTFYEARLNAYRTKLHNNILENTNEDQDADGRLDMGEMIYGVSGQNPAWVDVNGDGIVQYTEDLNGNAQFDYELDSNRDGIPDYGHDLGLDGLPFTNDYGENDGMATTEDLDGDGRFDNVPEDLNRNGLWDYRVFGPDHDLYTDNNHNGFVDASEVGPDSTWIPWNELPSFGMGAKDDDGYFKYGQGNTYHPYRWHEDENITYNAQFHLTSQINPHHQMKTGVEGSYYDIMYYDVQYVSGGQNYGEDYRIFPYSLAAYVQDKMEFEGLIVNAGLRFDYFKANWDSYPGNPEDPVLPSGQIKDPTAVQSKSAWSPRLGISHPITDRDVLYFNYGRYFQVPRFDYMFRNLTFAFGGGGFPIMGNANLNPERTTSYELGVKHQFANDLVLNITGFYKDITGLTDILPVYYNPTNWYGLYVNTDYGNVRGFEVTLIRPRIRYFSGTLTYTYSFARGKSSSSRAGYEDYYDRYNIPTTEIYLDWDQRHTVSANLDLRTLDKQRYFDIPYTENLGLNLIVEYGSGMPWSPPAKDADAWKTRNTRRMPYTLNIDMIGDKGFRINRFYTKVFVEVRNLLNRLNLLTIADEQRYAQTGDPAGQYNDPRVYSPPRIIRLGASVQF